MKGLKGKILRFDLNFLALFCDIREKRSVFNGF